MHDLDTYLLRSFITVAEHGTIGGAARILHRTQAAVSMQIRRLEDALNTVLFDRTSGGMRLNEAGTKLLPLAREVFLALQQLQLAAGTSQPQRLRVGVIEDVAASRLPAVLQDHSRRHPDIAVDLVVGGNRMIGQMFSRGEIDIAICDVAELHDVRPAVSWQAELVWTATADLVASAPAPLPVVMFSQNCSWRERAIAALNASGTPWATACEASTLVAMTTAIVAGTGAGLLLSSMIPPGCVSLTRNVSPDKVRICFGVFLNVPSHAPVRDFVAALGEPADA